MRGKPYKKWDVLLALIPTPPYLERVTLIDRNGRSNSVRIRRADGTETYWSITNLFPRSAEVLLKTTYIPAKAEYDKVSKQLYDAQKIAMDQIRASLDFDAKVKAWQDAWAVVRPLNPYER